MSQGYIATCIGCSPKTVTRSFSKLRTLGLIKVVSNGVKKPCWYTSTFLLHLFCQFPPFMSFIKTAVFFALALANTHLNTPHYCGEREFNRNVPQLYIRNYLTINSLTRIANPEKIYRKKTRKFYGKYWRVVNGKFEIIKNSKSSEQVEQRAETSTEKMARLAHEEKHPKINNVIYIGGKPVLPKSARAAAAKFDRDFENQITVKKVSSNEGDEAMSNGQTVAAIVPQHIRNEDSYKAETNSYAQQQRDLKIKEANIDPIKEIAKLRYMATLDDSPFALAMGKECAQNFYLKLADSKEKELIESLNNVA